MSAEKGVMKQYLWPFIGSVVVVALVAFATVGYLNGQPVKVTHDVQSWVISSASGGTSEVYLVVDGLEVPRATFTALTLSHDGHADVSQVELRLDFGDAEVLTARANQAAMRHSVEYAGLGTSKLSLRFPSLNRLRKGEEPLRFLFVSKQEPSQPVSVATGNEGVVLGRCLAQQDSKKLVTRPWKYAEEEARMGAA